MFNKEEDIVKYGRNLPGYLQCSEKSAYSQEKAFSFGVLNWSRLENWKSNKKCNIKASISGNNLALERGLATSSTLINNSISHCDQQPDDSQPNSSHREILPTSARSRGKAVKPQVSETVPRRTPYGSKGKQPQQAIALEKESSFLDTVSTHFNATKLLSKENIYHDDDICLNGHESFLFSESRTSHDRNLKRSKERRLSDCFSAENFHHLNPSSDILHSCPFPLVTNPDPEFPYGIPYPELKDGSLKDNIITHEAGMKFDLDTGEQPFIKERYSSLNRRFSFSIEKMAKSLNFKTSSAYKSLKSGLTTLGSSLDLHDYNSTKVNATNRVRSIPIMNRKGRQQSNISQISTNTQALLQLTMKNGIPFFKLVVNNSSNILAAAVKKLPSGKDDSSLTYTFYSVQDMKKKSGFRYNIVGQMKISSSYHAELSGLERDLFVVRESVLYGPEFAQSDQITHDHMLIQELAAIVVKNTSGENYGGIRSSKSTVVILPGGTHSLPKSGQPSSLINRWRSGGECDCGGWDIACELRVLTNQSESIKIPIPSTSDRLDLCYQGRHNDKNGFSLAPLDNGIYSLEYDTSISLLQAFSICVAVVSSQNLTHIFQVNHLQNLNDFSKPVMSQLEHVKSKTVHAKIPPVSPIGRI